MMQRTRPERMVKKNILVNTITETMRILGCTPKLANGYMYVITNIAMIFFIFATVLEAIALVIADDAERRFECFSVLTFGSMGILKLSSLRLCKDQWMYLLNQIIGLEKQQMENKDSSPEEYESDEEHSASFDTHTEQYTGFETTSLIVFNMYGITGIIYILSPFLEYTFKNNDDMDKHEEYPHILPIWIPLDSSNILVYVGTVLIELIAAVFTASVHAAFDISVIGLMIFCRSQAYVLRQSSENIAGSGKLCNISRDRDVRGLFRIKKCHRLHIFLIDFIKKLGGLLKYILGVYYLMASFTLCTVVVRLNSELSTTMELMRMFQYLCATLTQLFLFCYYGNIVLSECSTGVGEGPNGSAYWCLSPHVRRELILLATGMCRPLKLPAGPFHTLDLASFSMILRTAYSYYAVLRQ